MSGPASVDALLAGMQQPVFQAKLSSTVVAGRPFSFYGVSGIPGGGSTSSTLNGATYSQSSGALAGFFYHTDPPTGKNSYLAKFLVQGLAIGPTYLVDRLWDNQLTINSTSSQSITSPTWPARDQNGQTSGVGVELGLEVNAVTSATAAVISVSYTNSAGTSGRTATFLDATSAGAVAAGNFFRLALAAGDQGVQSVQSAQFSTAWTSGTINLVAYRKLAPAVLAQAGGVSIDVMTGGLPQLYNGVCPFVLAHAEAGSTGVNRFFYQEVWG